MLNPEESKNDLFTKKSPIMIGLWDSSNDNFIDNLDFFKFEQVALDYWGNRTITNNLIDCSQMYG